MVRRAELLALKAQPTILHVQSTPPLDHWTGDATTAYALDLGLKRFVRHVLFVKPDTLIDADEIQANREVELELRSHPETEPAPHGNAFLSRGKLASLLLQPLTSDGVQVSLDSVQSAARSGHGSSRMAVVRLLTHRSSWHNAVALPCRCGNRARTRIPEPQTRPLDLHDRPGQVQQYRGFSPRNPRGFSRSGGGAGIRALARGIKPPNL